MTNDGFAGVIDVFIMLCFSILFIILDTVPFRCL